MLLTTGISPKYVKNWDTAKALREILQNHLDSKKEFNCSGTITWRAGYAIISDKGPGLQLKHLALGISEKGPGAIGKYGEGLKLALLVLARENRKVAIRSIGKFIRPMIKLDKGYGTEVLVLKVEDDEQPISGTKVIVQCTEAELIEAKRYFVEFVQDSADFQWIEKNKISLPGGNVYVNGARVGQLDGAVFSYHLDENETGDIGNRDREVVDSSKLRNAVCKLLGLTSSREVIEGIFGAMSSQMHAEYNIGFTPWFIPNPKRRVWKRVFNQMFGTKVLIGTGGQDDTEARYRGYSTINVSYEWRTILASLGVRTAGFWNDASAKVKRSSSIKWMELTDTERTNLLNTKILIERHLGRLCKVVVKDNLDSIVPMAENNSANGAYSPGKDVMYLRRSILVSATTTLHTMVHEYVHKTSGAGDCTAAFEKALVDATVWIIRQGNRSLTPKTSRSGRIYTEEDRKAIRARLLAGQLRKKGTARPIA